MGVFSWLTHPIRGYRRRRSFFRAEEKFAKLMEHNLEEIDTWDLQDEAELLHGHPWNIEKPTTLWRVEELIKKFTLDLTQLDKQVRFLSQYVRYLHHQRDQLKKETQNDPAVVEQNQIHIQA